MKPGWRRKAPATSGWGSASLVLYGVGTQHFETDTGDGFRAPGYSKEYRREPQIMIGLLTNARENLLLVEAFGGTKEKPPP